MVTAEEIPEACLSEQVSGSVLTYDAVTNFSRAVKGASQLCVMCGHGGCKNGGVVIPRQNKDVCRECDKALWRHETTGSYFKWCKGCKNFLVIGNFSQKLDAAKCDRCRERGRTSYLLKKRSGGCGTPKAGAKLDRKVSVVEEDDEMMMEVCGHQETDSVAAISLVALARHGEAMHSSCCGHDHDCGDGDEAAAAPASGEAPADRTELSAVGESAVEEAVARAALGALASGCPAPEAAAAAAPEAAAGDRGAASSSSSPAPPDDDTDTRMSSNFGVSLLQYQRKRSLSEATEDDLCDSASQSQSAAELSVESDAGSAGSAGPAGPAGPAAVAVEDDASSNEGKSGAPALATVDEDKGMLFELANIHATIIKLEQRAGQVEPLEARVADLERRLEASAARERLLSDALAKAAPGETPNKLADDAKRPRLISFDDK